MRWAITESRFTGELVNADLRQLLRRTVIACRVALERAVADRLEGRFTIQARGGKLIAERKAPVTHLDDPERALRLAVLDHFDELAAQGVAALDAYRQLFREVAFTWLNRFVALKMLESRKLVRETLARPLGQLQRRQAQARR